MIKLEDHTTRACAPAGTPAVLAATNLIADGLATRGGVWPAAGAFGSVTEQLRGTRVAAAAIYGVQGRSVSVVRLRKQGLGVTGAAVGVELVQVQVDNPGVQPRGVPV